MRQSSSAVYSLCCILSGLVLAAMLVGCSDDNSGSDSDSVLPLPETTDTTYVDERYRVRGADHSYIEDTHTGLVWKRCADGQSWDTTIQRCIGRASVLRFEHAYGKETVNDGVTGFVMPTLEQLQTLIYCPDQPLTADNIGQGECSGTYNQATLATQVFPDAERRTHWTSTCMSQACNTYYGVDFSTGLTSEYNSPNASYPLRRVRVANP